MFQTSFEPFLQVNESTFYVQDDDLEQMCAVCGQPARRFSTQLGEFFCSERCVRLSRMLSEEVRNQTQTRRGRSSDGLSIKIGG